MIRPKIRLLFDENTQWRVAKALHALKFRASWVGNEDNETPERGSADRTVLTYARKTNQVIVTINYDMVLLCAEEREPVIWLDPRGRQFRGDELARVCLDHIANWEEALKATDEPVCIHQFRTKNEVITLERAAHLANQRIRRRRYKETARRRRISALGDLPLAWNDEEE